MIKNLYGWDDRIFYALNGWRHDLLDILMPVFSMTWLLWALILASFSLWIFRIVRGRADGGISGTTRRSGSTWVGRIDYRKKQLRKVVFGMLLFMAASGVTDIVTMQVKDLGGRARPYQTLPKVHYKTGSGWYTTSSEFTPTPHRADSFFSGHAAHSMTVAVTAATLCPPLSPLIYAMPLVVGYSRIYLGRHYPSDILGGWLAGALVAFIARRVFRSFR